MLSGCKDCDFSNNIYLPQAKNLNKRDKRTNFGKGKLKFGRFQTAVWIKKNSSLNKEKP